MGVNKVDLSTGETLIDISNDTVTPETLAKDVTAHNAEGELIVGTMVAGSNEPTIVNSGACGENATWELYSDGKFVVSGTGATADGNGYATHEWAVAAQGAASIVISDGITKIGNYFFLYFANASSIDFPDSLTEIGQRAFRQSGLVNVVLPERVTKLGTRVFQGCASLKSVALPNDIKELPGGLFESCSSLESLKIPQGVTTLGGSLCYGCESLTSVTIPSSVTSIGTGAFSNCTNLLNATVLSSGVLSAQTFYSCSNLKAITISDGITSIGKSAFYGCTNLETVLYSGSKSKWDAITVDTYNEPLLNAILCCEYDSGGGTGENTGIIDVTELPTVGINRKAVYRLTENVQVEKTEVYIKAGGTPVTWQQYLTSLGVSTVPNIYVVDELPTDMKVSDAQTFSEIHLYILTTDGIVYANVPAYGGVITLGLLGFQATGYDKGFTENIYAETENGVYTTIEAYKQVEKYFIYENNEWKEISAHIFGVSPHGLTAVNVLDGVYNEEELVVKYTGEVVDSVDMMNTTRSIPCVKVDTPCIADIIGGLTDIGIDETYFRKKDGTNLMYIRKYAFYNVFSSNVKKITTPIFIREIAAYAFANNYMRTVTIKGAPNISTTAFDNCPYLTTINVRFSEGEIPGAPWGATNATINYNYTGA